MKNNYIKHFLNVIIWPIIFMIGSFLINFIFVAIFNSKERVGMTNNEFIKHIKTFEYQNKLNDFINSKTLLIILIMLIVFLPLFYKLYKKYQVKSNFNIKKIYIPLAFGISISLIYNILVFSLNNIFHFTDNFDGSNLPIVVQIVSSGIVGPILEEMLFRGIIYNRLKEFNKPMASIIITSILFGVFHTDVLNAIYAFGVSFILIFLYEKYKSIKAPIIMHIALNITIILMLNTIKLNILTLNIFLVFISTIILLILRKNIIKTV